MARRRLVVITDKLNLHGDFYTAGYEGGHYPTPLRKIPSASRQLVCNAYRSGVKQARCDSRANVYDSRPWGDGGRTSLGYELDLRGQNYSASSVGCTDHNEHGEKATEAQAA